MTPEEATEKLKVLLQNADTVDKIKASSDEIKNLINQGANPKVQVGSEKFQTAAFMLTAVADYELMEMLEKKDAFAREEILSSDGYTATHNAAAFNNRDALMFLAKFAPNSFDLKDPDGKKPLDLVTDPDLVKATDSVLAIGSLGHEISYNGDHYIRNKPERESLLNNVKNAIKRGADLTVFGHEDKTVAHLAAATGDLELLGMLDEKVDWTSVAYKRNSRTTSNGPGSENHLNKSQPIHFAANCQNEEALLFFAKKGLDFNTKDGTGETVWGIVDRLDKYYKTNIKAKIERVLNGEKLEDV